MNGDGAPSVMAPSICSLYDWECQTNRTYRMKA